MPFPTVAAARVAGNGVMKSEHLWVVLAVLAGGGLLLWAGLRASPGGGMKVPARSSEDTAPFVPPPGYPVASVDVHMGGVVVSPHRYPISCGQEISSLIKYGHATLRIPHMRDIEWLTNPPSEASL